MKQRLFFALIFAAITFGSSLYQAHAAPQMLEGVVSDSMCIKKHMMPGVSSAKCAQECAKGGSAYVLVAGNRTYTLQGKPAAIASFAGKHVQVQGELKQMTVSVKSIHETGSAR